MSDLRLSCVLVVFAASVQSVAGTVPPTVASVIAASDFGGSPSVASGSFIEIYGANLAATTRQWNRTDFDGPNAPGIEASTATLFENWIFACSADQRASGGR